jgi:uncharacterized protein (DUF924 family)
MTPETIIDFWFGKKDSLEYGKSRPEWFKKDRDFDDKIRSLFLPIYQQAARGKLDFWREKSLSCLALIITLDQFPRNLFRDESRAFATDKQALLQAEYAVSQGFDRVLLPVQRWFIYLPFEHNESEEIQHRGIKLWSSLADDPNSISAINYAYQHLAVIERFGRFPHRNQILGRVNTAEEEEFLQQLGSSF